MLIVLRSRSLSTCLIKSRRRNPSKYPKMQAKIYVCVIAEKMQANGGVLPFTDKASPELIKEQMDMSKNEFKRAVGNLLKAGKIEIGENEIRWK